MEVVYLPLSAVAPYEGNARKHQDEDVSAIVESIKEFGFNDPIGIWSDRNVIVEGHGRYLAAQELGMKEVPTIRLDHLTDEQRRAYALAHNRTAELSEWDETALELELADIPEFDMALFGFTEKPHPQDYDGLFKDAEPKEKKPKEYICPHCGATVEG